MQESNLKKLETFLEGVDLQHYREIYRPIKLVEMDLPKNIQALEYLYKIYWDEKRFIGFEEFYKEYLGGHKVELEDFRTKITMCDDCFYRGLPARIYRTWASIVTQIHAGYVAEYVFGKDTVSMSEDLDHQGIDFKVIYRSVILNYQVKKETHSREVRREKKSTKIIEGEFVNILYLVPSAEYFNNPKRKNGEFRKPYLDFMNNKDLKRLNNGFVVFTPHTFEERKEMADAIVDISRQSY
jgi:hypothetical protein